MPACDAVEYSEFTKISSKVAIIERFSQKLKEDFLQT